MPAPGPATLGRGVVVHAGFPPPPGWSGAPTVTIDESVLTSPGDTVRRLHAAWASREPIVIALAVDPQRFRQPPSFDVEPWRLAPDAEAWFDRLQFLTWANTYDARTEVPIWWWAVKAARLAEGAAATPDGPADIVLPDGSPAWVDGGPRSPLALDDPVVHGESVDAGRLSVAPPVVAPSAALAPDQLAAVAHGGGPARVIAPAGSGKTRVLTERLRHLHVDRDYERSSVLAVAYNKQAQLEMESRTTDFGPRVRTLNSLGLWVLAEHRGASPPVLDEPEVRRLIESLLPGRRQRRANTDPIGPYVEGLTAIRLGLTDPDDVEAARDDVPGLAELFPAYRRRLAERGAVDFDEQIYAAVEALLTDGEFRRSMQRSCRHLLVDEFQDLTPAHVLLIRLLACPALDVFGVGDDDQCIYGHAGADPAFLIDYERLFPGAVPHPLTVNYRCPVDVVAGARTLLGYNHRRVGKQIDAGPGERPNGWRAARRRARPRRRRHGCGDGRAGVARRAGRAGGVDRRAGPGELAAAGAARGVARGRCADQSRCCAPTCSSAPACAPRSPTSGWRRRPTRWPPTTSSRSCAGRRVDCRSGSPSASDGGRAGRWPSSPRWSTRCRTRRAARCCASPTTSASCSTSGAPAPTRPCSRPSATRSASARR